MQASSLAFLSEFYEIFTTNNLKKFKQGSVGNIGERVFIKQRVGTPCC